MMPTLSTGSPDGRYAEASSCSPLPSVLGTMDVEPCWVCVSVMWVLPPVELDTRAGRKATECALTDHTASTHRIGPRLHLGPRDRFEVLRRHAIRPQDRRTRNRPLVAPRSAEALLAVPQQLRDLPRDVDHPAHRDQADHAIELNHTKQRLAVVGTHGLGFVRLRIDVHRHLVRGFQFARVVLEDLLLFCQLIRTSLATTPRVVALEHLEHGRDRLHLGCMLVEDLIQFLATDVTAIREHLAVLAVQTIGLMPERGLHGLERLRLGVALIVGCESGSLLGRDGVPDERPISVADVVGHWPRHDGYPDTAVSQRSMRSA